MQHSFLTSCIPIFQCLQIGSYGRIREQKFGPW
jgi:hypothetical protein